MITQKQVKALFKYREGDLIRIKNSLGRGRVGGVAGCLNPRGYWVTTVNGKQYKNHRLIYLYHYGFIPELIDHIDGNPANNKIENLRPCSISENGCNSKKPKNNTSGVKGVCWCKSSKKWVGKVYYNNKLVHVGLFRFISDAVKAVKEKRAELHGDFANDG